jgi:hypothetical protein
MKIPLLMLFLCILSFKGYSQFYSGYLESNVRSQIISNNENKPVPINKKILNTQEGSFSLIWNGTMFNTTQDCELSVTFANGVSNCFICVPSSAIVLKQFVNFFNVNFIAISSSQWKVYKNGKTYSIILSYDRKIKKQLFTFSLGAVDKSN